MQNRRTLITSGGLPGAVKGSNAKALDVLFSKNDGSELVVIHGQQNWPDSGWTPIGIVVVPGSHNRYGDGSCGVMSLVGMASRSPENGYQYYGTEDSEDLLWGHYNYSVGNSIFASTTALTSTSNFIPVQRAEGSTDTYFFSSSDNAYWPYGGGIGSTMTSDPSTAYTNTNGYVQAITGKSGCDFNGIRNTAAIYVKTRTSEQWTDIIWDQSDITYTPAAACAGRFKTVGTKSFLNVHAGITSNNIKYGTPDSPINNTGFWYLPAEGEMCYLPSKKFEINKIISDLNQKYGGVGSYLWTSTAYHSSSELNEKSSWCISLYSGMVVKNDKNSRIQARAFLRFKGDKEPIEYVDLGLPSGLKWTKYNVDANSETGYGSFYMYGAGTNTFDYSVTPYAGTENPLSSSYDTATQVLGSEWRMPTEAEVTELINNTNYSWTTVSGVTGAKFTSKTDSTKYIFFPASGYYYNGNYEAEGSEACIWTATPGDSNEIKYLSLESSGPSVGNIKRSCGFAVRGVKASS